MKSPRLRFARAAAFCAGAVLTTTLLFAQEPRLANLSTLTRVGTGADVLTAGFVINGTTPKQVVIRGVGLSNDIGGGLLAPAREGQLRAMRAAAPRMAGLFAGPPTAPAAGWWRDDHVEQLRHYTSWVYAAVNAIAQEVARQRAYLCRTTGPAGRMMSGFILPG